MTYNPRRTSLRSILVILVGSLAFALTPPDARAQSRNTENTLRLDEGGARATATIDQVAWMAGAWQGEAFGGSFEEVWSPPTVGTMVGTFKLMHDDQPSMYEFQVVVEDGDSLSIRLKHFNADLSGWEGKDDYVEFPLVKLTEDAAYFSGLTYRRLGPDELEVFVVVKQKDGLHEERLAYRRMN